MSKALFSETSHVLVENWRPAPSPIGVLRACGWLAAHEAASPDLRIDAIISSHALFRVTAPDGRCVVIKQLPRESAENNRSLRQEMFMYRLAAWMPEIAAIVPVPVFLDEGRQVIVVESLAAGPCWPDPDDAVPISLPGVARVLGVALSRLHRATANMGMWPSPAVGVLGLGTDVEEACRGRVSATRELMQLIAADAILRASLNEGLGMYQTRCVIHGDLRPENWLRDDRDGACGIRLLDWELGGSGDPAWDLASLVAEAVADSLRCGQPLNGPWPPSILSIIRDALHGYFENDGLLMPGDDNTWRKLACFASARLLHVATECAEQGIEHEEWPVKSFVGAARLIAGDISLASSQLRQLAEA